VDITGESSEAIELARALAQNASWSTLSKILNGLNENPDTIIMMLKSYMSKILIQNENNVAFNVLVSLSRYSFGMGMSGLIQCCYESMIRNKKGQV
jgi:hypothetical protein